MCVRQVAQQTDERDTDTVTEELPSRDRDGLNGDKSASESCGRQFTDVCGRSTR
jgi:hypothetical protein